MREILFRGKHEDTKEWEYGSLHIQNGEVNENDNQELEYRILGLRGELDYVIPETVGQYTGLTANGKKIFEGDVVKVFFKDGVEIGYIRYRDAGCRFQFMGEYSIGYNIDNTTEFEIIGNIHDNPELLGGGEE